MAAPKTILIIDDEQDIVDTLQTILTEAGYHVITANNGVEGLHKLSQIIPHLIILDMNMPEMGGIAFYREILNPKTGKTNYPVLVFTARSNLEDLFKHFEIDGFMSKPFSIEELFQKVTDIMVKHYGKDDEAQRKEPSKRVLIIEDKDESYNNLYRKFVRHDYAVFRSTTGSQAVKESIQHNPHIILLKLKLPDFTGDVIALKLKMMPLLTEVPMIIYSEDKEEKMDFSSTGRIYDKLGVKLLIGKSDPNEFLTQAELLLNPQSKAA